jgi:UDP-4-amino-4,6-dideoxy-N-acetyl-beta-L-altrosamine N-acetyltransferase
MIVEQYGLKYIRVREEDIELIRYWRNQPFIRDTMQFKEYITPEMQKRWFEKINNKYNYYFIIEADGKKIGLINCKDTEPNTRIAEGGIFIWDKEYWGTPIPGFAALTMLQCIFEIFQSGDVSVVTVAKNNERALTFNKRLGYIIKEESKNNEFLKLVLTKEWYLQKTIKLKRAAALFYGGNSDILISADESDLLVDEINAYLRNRSK